MSVYYPSLAPKHFEPGTTVAFVLPARNVADHQSLPQTGAICLDILKDQWSPALSIKTVLQSLQALMCAPEPDDPQDAVVAGQYKSQRADFDAKAAQWTKQYAVKEGESSASDVASPSGGGGSSGVMAAGPPATPPTPSDPKLAQLLSMGFPERTARDALDAAGGNVETAVMALLSG